MALNLISRMMSDWYKDEYFWRHPGSGDAGDLIYNTMARVIDMGDRSNWAHESYYRCKKLLEQGKRWPNYLSLASTAPNFLVWWFCKGYTRPQCFMTRDPYVAVIACAFHLGRGEEVVSITIPWYCYSRETWRWRRRLIEDNRPAWRRRLTHYKALATGINTMDDPNIIANMEDI